MDLFGDGNFINGNKTRIFVNPSLGCEAGCKYCYLPKLDLALNTPPKITTAESIIDYFEKYDIWVKGQTIISIGCYTEPWSSKTKKVTKKIIDYFLKFNNPIQIATKQELHPSDCDELVIFNNSKKYLTFFISMPVVNEAEKHEPGTAGIKKRIKNFRILKEYGFRGVLYIKPVLQSKTINGLETYKYIIDTYKVDTVLGAVFNQNGKGPISSVLSSLNYKEHLPKDYFNIWNQLSSHGQIYANSVDVIKKFMR